MPPPPLDVEGDEEMTEAQESEAHPQEAWAFRAVGMV